MITQKYFEFLLKSYTKAVAKFWQKEKNFLKRYIEEMGKSFEYFEKPLESMINIYGDKGKLSKHINYDAKINFNNMPKIKSFLLTPGNIPLIEIEYLYFLILVSKEILWRPSRKFLKISKKLNMYFKKNNLNFIKITNKDLNEIKHEIKNRDLFVLVGSDKTLSEFKGIIPDSKKIIEYGSKTSAGIILEYKGIGGIIKDITYFSHAGCLSPTIVFISEKTKDDFLKEFKNKIKNRRNIFNKKEKLFNYYLCLSENIKSEKTGEFHVSINPENILILKGFINLIIFKRKREIIEKLISLKNYLQGISLYPYDQGLKEEIKKNLGNIYIKEAGKLQIIDEKFFPDGIKPIRKIIELFNI